MDKPLYEWGRHTLRKIDNLGRDVLRMDSDKRAEIPADKRTGIIKRLKEQQDGRDKKKRDIFKRMNRNL